MSARNHEQDGAEILDRIGRACDLLAARGFGAVGDAIAGHARERRGQLRKATLPPDEVARHLIALADQVERLLPEPTGGEAAGARERLWLAVAARLHVKFGCTWEDANSAAGEVLQIVERADPDGGPRSWAAMACDLDDGPASPGGREARERARVFADIDRERASQDDVHGGPGHDDTHTANEWLGFMREHLSMSGRAFLTGRPTEGRQRLVEVAALVVAALGAFDRQTPPSSPVEPETGE